MIVNFSAGNVAAFLTILEFILCVFLGYSVKACIHGAWLLSIRHTEKLHLDDTMSSQKHQKWVSVIVFIISSYLVMSVAFLENALSPVFVVRQKPEIAHSFCINLNMTLHPKMLLLLPSPFQLEVPTWTLKVLYELQCKSGRGIDSMGTGRYKIYSRNRVVYNAPVCRSDILQADMSATVGVISGNRRLLVFNFG